MSLSTQYPATVPSLLLDFANTKRLDPRITFARASTARYYDGKTFAKAEENLLLWSQDFSQAAWTKTTITQGSLATAPDGTATAASLTAAGANSSVVQSVTAVAGDYTFSVWLRRVTGTGNIDISAHSGGTWVTQTITSSWARYTVTQTLTAGARTPGIRIVTDTDAVEVWGAQLEQRSAATAYTATTTQPITRYQPQLLTAAANVARFDHNPITGESLGLLIEESRSNLLTFTEDFGNAAWSAVQASIAVNTAVAPDGALTADQLVENTATAVRSVSRASSGSAGTAGAVFTASVYVKAAGRTIAQVRAILGTTNYGVEVNLTTGAVSAIPGEIPTSFSATNVGNGWYRVVLTGTAGATTGLDLEVRPCSAAGVTNYTGDGYSGIFIWGAQLEAGAFPTSYIARVDATAASRAADAASMTGTNFSSWYNPSAGTLYADSSAFATTAARRIFQVDDGTSANRMYLGSETTIFGLVRYNSAAQADLTGPSVAANTFYKGAFAYNTNDFALSTSGAAAVTDTSGNVPPVTTARFGISEGAVVHSGTIRKIAYYPTRLTNAQLQALTR